MLIPDCPPIPPLPAVQEAPPPPRPPLPEEIRPPPRPPMPNANDTDDEEGVFSSEPGTNQPIHVAAHGLYQEVKQWDHTDNEIIAGLYCRKPYRVQKYYM